MVRAKAHKKQSINLQKEIYNKQSNNDNTFIVRNFPKKSSNAHDCQLESKI